MAGMPQKYNQMKTATKKTPVKKAPPIKFTKAK